jgi:hypothetical protein
VLLVKVMVLLPVGLVPDDVPISSLVTEDEILTNIVSAMASSSMLQPVGVSLMDSESDGSPTHAIMIAAIQYCGEGFIDGGILSALNDDLPDISNEYFDDSEGEDGEPLMDGVRNLIGSLQLVPDNDVIPYQLVMCVVEYRNHEHCAHEAMQESEGMPVDECPILPYQPCLEADHCGQEQPPTTCSDGQSPP